MTDRNEDSNVDDAPSLQEARTPDARVSTLVDLHIIPVDSHRLFAHWHVDAEVIAKAEREISGKPQDTHLALRVFDVVEGDGGQRATDFREDFPANAGWHEGFFSLQNPGGSVVAALGIKNATNQFTPLVTTLPVSMPDAPIPDGRNRNENDHAQIRKTFDERNIVLAALNTPGSELLIGSSGKEAPKIADAAFSASSSSFQLASQFDSERDSAPIRIEATLVISGRLQSGHRLRVGNREVEIHPGGAFSWEQHLDLFSGSWVSLLHAIADSPEPDGASMELLTQIPDGESPLTLHSRVEIEGELRDSAYRSYLPKSISVDAAGRFRLIRTPPATALFLPQLVLIADQFASD